MSKNNNDWELVAIFRRKVRNTSGGGASYFILYAILSFVVYVLDIILTAIFYNGSLVFILIYTVFIVIPVAGSLYFIFSKRKKKTKQTLNRK